MRCPICGKRTSVTTSRTSDNPSGYKVARLASEAVSWYTQDWVVRIRSCNHCGWGGPTVELLLEDFDNGWDRSKAYLDKSDPVSID